MGGILNNSKYTHMRIKSVMSGLPSKKFAYDVCAKHPVKVHVLSTPDKTWVEF